MNTINKENRIYSISIPNMTNEEYREKLNEIFDDINENYILRYFYIFISEKMKLSRK